MSVTVPTATEFDSLTATVEALTTRVQALEAQYSIAVVASGVFGRAVFKLSVYS